MKNKKKYIVKTIDGEIIEEFKYLGAAKEFVGYYYRMFKEKLFMEEENEK